MKLRALELEQFRKFDRRVRIDGMADGLNLVTGPNEMGKSTLFAALQAVLFERHRSQAQTVKSLQPAGHEGASPRVALSFEIGGQRYRIEKRFLRRPGAELSLPDGRQLHGEAAEEALESLLAGGDAAGQGGGRRSPPDAVWGLLWVGQGQSFVQPEIGAGARATLQAALDGAVGEILGGDHGPALIGALDQALHELVYKAGKPRGRYKEADDARRALAVEITDLEARREELERDRNELDAVRAEHQRLQAEQRSGQEEVRLAELAARRDQLTVQRAEIREAEAALASARHGLAQAELERAHRQALREAMAAAEAELTEATAAASEAVAAAAAADGLAREQAGKVERLQATLDQVENRRRGLQRLAEAIRQRDDGRAALRAAASEVALELEPAALDRVRVDGRPLGAASRSLRIVDPLEIVIAGVGRIRVRPVVADRRRLRGSLRDAERRIARELEVQGLRPPGAKARQLEFKLAAGGPLLAGQRAAELEASTADAPSCPEAAAVETAQAEAERQIGSLLAQLRPARREQDLLLEDRHRRSAARDQAAERSAQAERRREQLRAELGAAERQADEAALGARVTELRGEVVIADRRWRELQERLPADALEDLERRIVELRQVVDSRAAALRQRELALEGLRARIQALAGGGLDERLAGARRRLDELARECAKYRREAEALELLLRVLRDAERDAKERYVGPLLRRLRPYLQALFPGCELALDEGFRITAVARAGAPEPFERLSDGTREQIAILARLAFAELLAEQGRPAVVVLDDALAFADDRRIERMFAILADAARQLQIIVLTCRERVFQDLAAHRLRLEQVQAAGVH